ncbi:uncharacterized protein LOC105430312 [Pogonomyrmex barbatus]|uniref:Uncharacterized protein LOC105430312 n=1 Tax=Pogonomyrmex barbatus TaxID=144034 RepID=A0A6I9WR59_9HYME|nr:uncharacterized protein LOC105430312 [Pogonomyrmex barbatus]
MRPADITPAVAKRLLSTVQSLEDRSPREVQDERFGTRQQVQNDFEKGYTPKWTTKIFRIAKVQRTNLVTYLLKDYHGEPVAGGFYKHQLLQVSNPDIYLVEKVLRRKDDRVFVKWLGMDNTHNSYI